MTATTTLTRVESERDMPSPRLRTLRYARAWLQGPRRFEDEEVVLDRGDRRVHGTLTRPRGAEGALPSWVVLHGITRRGREHAQLQRFTRALVETGAVAIVPDVPEWRELDLAPRLAVPTIRAAIAGLRDSGWARDEPVGVIGFSFGAPHAIVATAHPHVASDVAGSVAFGAYCSLERTIRFLMTGIHEWEGRTHQLKPDAYGRWIFAANHLTAVPEYAHAADVAFALRSLALLAGDLGLPSLDARLDKRKATLRDSVAEDRRWLFDLFAPPASTLPDAELAGAAAEALAAAARPMDPLGDPVEALAGVTQPVHVLHGRNDVVIPYTEGLRLRAALPADTWSRVTVTRLFGHSGETLAGALRSARELPRFLGALRGVLRLV
jgi:pimeloyl-ACP methyl ester carboxylesterase